MLSCIDDEQVFYFLMGVKVLSEIYEFLEIAHVSKAGGGTDGAM